MTISKPVNVALVGCGAVSTLYYAPALQALEKLGQVRVAALYDPNLMNIAPIQRSFPAAAGVRDLNELFQMGVNLAIVASPPQYHAPQTIQLLQSGLAVLCEKPMALSLTEGMAMVTAASDAGRLLAIGLVRRFMPSAQTIHAIVSQNLLGEVKSFSFSEGRLFRWPVQSASYFRENGVLRDIGVHVLDLLLHWFGEPEEIVYEDDAMGGVEVNCRIHLKFPQGWRGEVRLSRDLELSNTCSIQCSNGEIRWDIDTTNKLQIGFNNASYSVDGQLQTMKNIDRSFVSMGAGAAQFDQCFLNQLQNVVAAVQGKEELVISGASGLASLKAIDRCYSNRQLMEMPWLSTHDLQSAWQTKDIQPK